MSNDSFEHFAATPEEDFLIGLTHYGFFDKIVDALSFNGTNLDKFDSYMLADGDISSFQHRSLDTDLHLSICSLMSTRFFINALDVLHSFTVLGSGVKVDAIVGRVNEMTMFFLREGLFFGQCSDYVEQVIIVCLWF